MFKGYADMLERLALCLVRRCGVRQRDFESSSPVGVSMPYYTITTSGYGGN